MKPLLLLCAVMVAGCGEPAEVVEVDFATCVTVGGSTSCCAKLDGEIIDTFPPGAVNPPACIEPIETEQPADEFQGNFSTDCVDIGEVIPICKEDLSMSENLFKTKYSPDGECFDNFLIERWGWFTPGAEGTTVMRFAFDNGDLYLCDGEVLLLPPKHSLVIKGQFHEAPGRTMTRLSDGSPNWLNFMNQPAKIIGGCDSSVNYIGGPCDRVALRVR